MARARRLIITAMDTVLEWCATTLIQGEERLCCYCRYCGTCILLTGALWVIVSFSVENLVRDFAYTSVVLQFRGRLHGFYVGIIGSRLFGLQRQCPSNNTERQWC
jgi:hypothetical protein